MGAPERESRPAGDRTALDVSLVRDSLEHSPDTDETPVLTPRAAWLLTELKRAGPKGVTSILYPGVRVADAIHKLRKAGYAISTELEPHAGHYPGRHARYRLGGADA